MKQQLLMGDPDVLLWPEQFFDDQWNPESGA
jgi:hypothetical protein